MVGIGKSVAGTGRLQANPRHDVAGTDHIPILPVIGVHLENPTDALARPRPGVGYGASLVEGAAVDPEVGQLADVGIGHDLEGQSGEWLTVGSKSFHYVSATRVNRLDGW